MMIIADIGIGPFDSFSMVISEVTGLNFGNSQFVLQTILFVILLLIIKISKQNYLEIFISLFSTFIATRIINLTYPIASLFVEYNKFFVFVVGFILLIIGVSINLKINIIINPVDKMVVAFSNISKIKVGTMKFASDAVFGVLTVIFTFLLNLDVNITITMVFLLFCTGPSINLLNGLILNKLDDLFI